jgi:hypothetical protein
MANYFPVALTGTARSWLTNVPQGFLTSWEDLCCQFMANLESAYARPTTRLTSTPCSSARGSHHSPSSSGSPRFKTPFPASPTLLLLSHFNTA